MIAAWKKQDPPPNRVKPVPIRVIHSIAFIAEQFTHPTVLATSDMIIITFFFLLRPGEYTASPSNMQPLDFKSVQLFIDTRRMNVTTASVAELLTSKFVSVTFDLQKDGVHGEGVGLGRSGHNPLCPVRAIARRIIHPRLHQAPPNTPLAMSHHNDTWHPVTPIEIYRTLREAVEFLGPALGFLSSEVSARCLRADGASVFLNAKVDPNIITLLDQWWSDTMLWYFTVQSTTLMQNYSQQMLCNGDYMSLYQIK